MLTATRQFEIRTTLALGGVWNIRAVVDGAAVVLTGFHNEDAGVDYMAGRIRERLGNVDRSTWSRRTPGLWIATFHPKNPEPKG